MLIPLMRRPLSPRRGLYMFLVLHIVMHPPPPRPLHIIVTLYCSLSLYCYASLFWLVSFSVQRHDVCIVIPLAILVSTCAATCRCIVRLIVNVVFLVILVCVGVPLSSSLRIYCYLSLQFTCILLLADLCASMLTCVLICRCMCALNTVVVIVIVICIVLAIVIFRCVCVFR